MPQALAETANHRKLVTKLKNWFSEEALRMVTLDNAELLMVIGPRHPYREGPLGAIAEDSFADPLENLDLIGDA